MTSERQGELIVRPKTLLAIDDPGSRRWYVSPEVRSLWTTAGAAVVALAAIVHGADAALWGTALFGIPQALATATRTLLGRRQRDPVRVPLPRPGNDGPKPMTAHLQRMYDAISPPHEERLRLTVFVVDRDEPFLLRQLCRYSTHTTNVSTAAVRMGTGDVGLAFTTCRTVHVSDVNDLGGSFAEAMRNLGLEDAEIGSHEERQRRSYFSIPLLDGNTRLRYGVLSMDAMGPAFFDRHRERVRKGVVPAYLLTLLDQIRLAGFPGLPMPEGVETDDIDPESADSAPRERPSTLGPRRIGQ